MVMNIDGKNISVKETISKVGAVFKVFGQCQDDVNFKDD
jgi:hypothetical protein